MSETSKPYAWIKKVPGAIVQNDTIPLLGDPPPFPWNDLANELKNLLEIQELMITPSEFVWMEEGSATKGMGDPLSIIPFSITSLNGPFFVAIPKNDVRQLLDTLLLKGSMIAPIDDQIQTAFLNFLTLEVIHTIQQLGYSPEFTPKLIENSTMPKSPVLGMDIAISTNTFKSALRVLISSELNQSLKEHYIKSRSDSIFQHSVAQNIDVILHLEAGGSSLSQEEWKEVKPGDFLLLDKCSLKPGKNSGTVTLSLKGHPILRGKIQDGNIKILENSLFREDTLQ